MEHLDHKRKVTIMVAVVAAMLFAALNQTIVGNALPRIISELGGMEYYSWVFTIYMLATSVTSILVGKLSDMYGRKPFLLIGIGIFIVGSFLSGTSTDIIQMIIYRGIQGLGSGMIMSLSFTVIGDLFAPRDRGRWQGLMGGAFGLASVFGPTLGGFIVDHMEWHWVFWVFLPFGLVAFILILMLFPKVERKQAEPVDYLGSLFLTLTIVPLLLAFSWAGSKYAWGSSTIISLLAAAVVALVIFIVAEKKAASPVLPLNLFRNNVFSISNMSSFLMGAGMFGAVMYMPFFIQGVLGESATNSSYITMPMMLSLVLFNGVAGQIISKTGKYKFLAVVGLVMATVGMALMYRMNVETSILTTIINMILVGGGLGLSMPVLTLAVQNAVQQKDLGVATASSQLFRSLGATIGVSIMGTVMSQRMTSKMSELSAAMGNSTAQVPAEVGQQLAQLQNSQVLLDPAKLQAIHDALPADFQAMFTKLVAVLREAMGYSLSGVFLTGAIIMALSIALIVFMKEIPLRTAAAKQEPAKEDDPETAAAVNLSKQN